MKQFDVVAMGELLIDFTENGISSQGNPLLEANPGGAPCNVLAMLAKLGKSVAFIGKVGNDQFGSQLKDTLRAVGIDMRGLVTDPVVHTTLAFVHTLPDGDRDFSFYRDPGADMMLSVLRPSVPWTVPDKPASKFPLTRIFVRPCGLPWNLPRNAWNWGCPAATI